MFPYQCKYPKFLAVCDFLQPIQGNRNPLLILKTL
nr:MAG TPA: Endonuclease I [Caudoviricetes sp.]